MKGDRRMQVVIDMPEENYEVLLTKIMLTCSGCKITELVKKHGRLIDADALDKDCESSEYHEAITSWLDLAPTIIKADN